SLFPLPQPEPAVTAGERVYVCVNILQGLVAPFTPMGIEAFRAIGRGVAGLVGVRVRRGAAPPAVKVAAGRRYPGGTPPLPQPGPAGRGRGRQWRDRPAGLGHPALPRGARPEPGRAAGPFPLSATVRLPAA